MPELPEVEVSRMGITPHVQNQVVTKVNIYNASMRWPVSDELNIYFYIVSLGALFYIWVCQVICV